MGLMEILEKYRSQSLSERDKGTKFEELMKRYFETDPVYAEKLEWVQLWDEFFAREELGGKDLGIDLVARTKDGLYWAIQCKCYAEDSRIMKEDVDSFISNSGRQFHEDGSLRAFSFRLIVATNNNWSDNAIEATKGQAIDVQILSLSQLLSANVDWDAIEHGVHGQSALQEKHHLRPHQQDALDAAMSYYRDHDRGKMIMACGTGKTFTSLRIAEAFLEKIPKNREHPGLILFLAPSISLVGQNLREWVHHKNVNLNTICVCSDKTVTKKRTETDDGENFQNLGLPSTTDPSSILSQYLFSKEPTVIFSTYQSIDAVITAQQHGLPDFDLIIADEAHRTTGVIIDKESETSFTKVHSNSNICAAKRIYMTATPRLYGEKGKEDARKASVVLCSMDDPEIYGDTFYTISFGQAVEKELLSDYKVLILTTTASDIPEIIKRHWTNGGKEIDADTECKLWGCMNALAKNVAFDDTLKETDPEPMHSAVSFSRSIKVSRAVTEKFNSLASEPIAPLKVSMDHIDGSMNAITRDKKLSWLKAEREGCHVLSNVRCLSEGVDVPALDAVMFLDSKGSLVDVVQSVGRVMRKAPGKKYGYIIIPIVVPEDEDPESALDNNERYKVVWQVLRALRSHDERLEAEINTFNYKSTTSSGHIIIGGIDHGGDEPFEPPFIGGQYTMDDFGAMLMARLVLKVGDREYIENWAKSVADIMPDLIGRLTTICQAEEYGTKQYKPAFKRYIKGLRQCVNDNVPESQAIDMLAQQIITKPIFARLFTQDGGFEMKNSVSGYIDKMLDEIDAKNGLKDIQEKLDKFYDTVELTLNGIDTTEGKQKVITALYEKFFKNAFPKDQAINGVVYTPQEIVDFIIHSCADVLKAEFVRDINDEGVNILDPFTGTGTFIARLLESGLITKENFYRKYANELFCNEITLLAYYIAIVNIENTFARISGSNVYIPFEHALLTDTFNIENICNQMTEQTTLDPDEYFKKNKDRIKTENNTQFTIIMGNPPYGANQKSANDNAKKRRYESGIDKRIKDTYLDESLFANGLGNVNAVYDNYVRAFRWASDRIGDNDGIIAFVTPNGWMTGSAFEGFRKCFEREYFKIYSFNFRGDVAGRFKEEGDNIFIGTSRGCRTGVSVTLLIKKKNNTEPVTIYYQDIMHFDNSFRVLDKRRTISSCSSFKAMEVAGQLEIIKPKSNGDWLVQRNPVFDTLYPIFPDASKKFDKFEGKSIFTGFSRGYGTSRDQWMYNYSKKDVSRNMSRMLEEYNRQVSSGVIEYDKTKISWNSSLLKDAERKKVLEFDDSFIIKGAYRPFCKQFLYHDRGIIYETAQMPRIYPDGVDNITICVSGVGVKKDFSCLITNAPTDLEIVGKSQCFPLYWYQMVEVSSDPKQRTLMGFETYEPKRHDGISDYALQEAKKRYGEFVTKEDIFYYVYGYLHSPDYRKAFSDDLKLSLPKIGFVESYNDFLAFSKAGRKLADLHLNYESVPMYEGVTVIGVEYPPANDDLYRVTKMRLDPESKIMKYNDRISIEGIPDEVFQYVVNGRNPLAWMVDQYLYSVDKESGIVNDSNEYAGPKYIFDLVLKLITVSVETMRIVNSLPKLDFSQQQNQ